MAKVEDIARTVLAAIDTNAGYVLALKWVADRYRRILAKKRFKSQRRLGELTLPASVTAGTITTARGSKIVTPDATALAAWSPKIVGRYFRASNVWYEITSFDGAVATLKSEFAESPVAAGTYNIVGRIHKLDPTVRWFGEEFIHVRLRRRLLLKSLEELNRLAPDRLTVGPNPEIIAEVGLVDQVKTVEIYPPANANDELIYYVFWATPDNLKRGDLIPSIIDEHVLVEGALIDAMRYKMAQAAEEGRVDVAAFWRNEYRAQETAWRRHVLDAMRADQGTDDLTFILQSADTRIQNTDITNASQEVFARGRL